MADPTAEVLKGSLESRVRYGRADESKQGMLDDELRDYMCILFFNQLVFAEQVFPCFCSSIHVVRHILFFVKLACHHDVDEQEEETETHVAAS